MANTVLCDEYDNGTKNITFFFSFSPGKQKKQTKLA